VPRIQKKFVYSPKERININNGVHPVVERNGDYRNMQCPGFRKNSFIPRRSASISTTGFTLMEVLVALAILGIGLTVIIELFSGGLRLARTSVEYTKAVNYGRTKLVEVALNDTMEEGSEEGEFDETYRWQVGVRKVDVLYLEPTTDYKPPAELYQIEINVIWKSGFKERSTRIETYKTVHLKDEEKES
jgi:general secretion pathway protein I